jgi:hypothetical protein
MWKLMLGYSIEQWGRSSCTRVLMRMSFPWKLWILCAYLSFLGRRDQYTLLVSNSWNCDSQLLVFATQPSKHPIRIYNCNLSVTCLHDLVHQLSPAVALLQCTQRSKGCSWPFIPSTFAAFELPVTFDLKPECTQNCTLIQLFSGSLVCSVKRQDNAPGCCCVQWQFVFV